MMKRFYKKYCKHSYSNQWKKRGLIQSETNMQEENLIQIINRDEKIFKYLEGKNIKRKIYIKDKLLNIII